MPLVGEWAAVALVQLDAKNHYRLRATRGRPEVGLAWLDKLDRTLGRRPARKKATGWSINSVAFFETESLF